SDRRRAPRQAQAGIHAALRHRGLRGRGQCGQDQGHREQTQRQGLLPPQRLSRRTALADARRDARAPTGGGHPHGGQGDAPPKPPRAPAAAEAEGLRRSRAPTRGAEAGADGGRCLMVDEERTEEEQQPEGTGDEAAPEDQGSEEQPAAPAQGDVGEEQQPEVAAEDQSSDEVGDESEPDVSEESEAPEPPEGTAPKTEDSEDQKKPPGAELEPIAIEPQRELGAEERARLEAEATAEGAEEPVPAREPAVEVPTDARIQATGKRKTSIARVIVLAGSGTFEINRRTLEDYFPRHQHQTLVRQPLLASGYEGKVDVRVRVHGGGIAGQAGAVRHGIARALTEIDADLRGELKRRGLLTRDARAKERRKAGLKKARKRPQFSKR